MGQVGLIGVGAVTPGGRAQEINAKKLIQQLGDVEGFSEIEESYRSFFNNAPDDQLTELIQNAHHGIAVRGNLGQTVRRGHQHRTDIDAQWSVPFS